MKRFFVALFAVLFGVTAAFAQTPSGGAPIAGNPGYGPLTGGGGGGITTGAPITGTCTSGQYVYNNAGVVACQTLTGGGNVSNFGTPVNGQIGVWNSATAIGGSNLGAGVLTALGNAAGAAGGFATFSSLGTAAFQASSAFDAAGAAAAAQAASVPLNGALGTPTSGAATNLTGLPLSTGITGFGANVATALGIAPLSSGSFTRQNGAIVNGNCLQWSTTLGVTDAGAVCGGGGGLSAQGAYTFLANNTAGTAIPTAVTGSAGLFTAMGNAIDASGGLLTYSSIGTSGATLGLNNGNNTLSGSVSHSGVNTFTGGPATSAVNTTSISGGTTGPTMGTNAGFLSIGGLLASTPAPGATSQGAIFIQPTNGITLVGWGSSCDVALQGRSGTVFACVQSTGGYLYVPQLKLVSVMNNTSGKLTFSGAAPTITSGGTIGTVNGTFASTVTATGGNATIVVALPAATTGWVCDAYDITTLSTVVVPSTPTTTSITLNAYSRTTGTASTFTASDVIQFKCTGY